MTSPAAARARVLLVEDEPMLRQSVAAGLSRLPGVEVDQAGSLAEAIDCLARRPPDVVVSDIDLPDRPGIELLGELGARNLKPHVLFVSAYVRAFRAWIPRSAQIEVLEKPVPLEVLRQLVLERVPRAGARPGPRTSPFRLEDYLQIAALGRRSVVLQVHGPSGLGEVVVVDGEGFSARDGAGPGPEALLRLLAEPDAEVTCLPAPGAPGARNLSGPLEALLLEAARLADEARARGEGPPPTHLDADPPTPAPLAPPVRTPPQGSLPPLDAAARAAFDEAWERGVQATLARDYVTARDAFLEAQVLSPGDKKVLANLQRLETLLKKEE